MTQFDCEAIGHSQLLYYVSIFIKYNPNSINIITDFQQQKTPSFSERGLSTNL
jgi:hypothetical protein